jgi:acetolactate synthase-1/2/3 large subunit
MSKQKKDGGDLLVQCLKNEGITKIFGIVGGELLSIYDAIERWGREKGIDTVMVRHEQAGGHAADAWARATGDLGVCLGTAGPGVTHLIPAVAAAWADSIPILVIGAQIGRMFENIGILQGDLDQMTLMKPITKLQVSVEEPYEIPDAVQRCIKAAMSGRRGPVFLELRETALVREAKDEDFKKILDPEQYRPIFKPAGNIDGIVKAVKLLKTANKPLIVAGGGVLASGAFNELNKLSETYKIPIGTTSSGIGAVSINKTFVGGKLTAMAYRRAAKEADVILSLGCKWDHTIIYGSPPIWSQNQKIIQVDIDPSEIGKNRPVNVAIIGDAKAVINQLLEEMERNLPKGVITKWSEWNDYLQEVRKQDKNQIEKMLNYDKLPMKPHRLIYEILDFVPDDAQLVIDGGDIYVFALDIISLKPRLPRSFFRSVSMGHLGTGIPYAIGVQMAKPDKLVICITGDGSFMFNVQELETAVRLNLPIITIIGNNCSWGMIKSNQKLNFGKRYCDVDFPSIDYSEIARSFGCYGEKISKPNDIKPALKRAIESKKPAVLDVEIAFETPTAMKLLGLFKKNRGLFKNP